MFVFVIGRRVRAFIWGFLGLDWPYTPSTRSPHIYFIVVYLFRSTDDVSLSLIPLVHVVDQEGTRYGAGHTGEQEPSGPGHRTRNTTPRAGTPVNRSQVAQDTAHATQHTERAHR